MPDLGKVVRGANSGLQDPGTRPRDNPRVERFRGFEFAPLRLGYGWPSIAHTPLVNGPLVAANSLVLVSNRLGVKGLHSTVQEMGFCC